MILTDGTRTVEITMKVWGGSHYSPDWSNDFFNAGLLAYDEMTNSYEVDDVEYCIDQAIDWQCAAGDYYDESDEEREVSINEIVA